MKRRLLIALLGFGTLFGFGSGISSMAHWHHHQNARRAAFERHVADVCVDAAYRARDDRAHDDRPYDRPPPRHHAHDYDYGY